MDRLRDSGPQPRSASNGRIRIQPNLGSARPEDVGSMIDPLNADDLLVVVDDVDNSVRAFVGAVVSSQRPV